MKTVTDTPPRVNTARILVVDDEPWVVTALKRVLEENEFAVEYAHCAELALSMFQSEHFDAVISDYRMKGMTGVQLLAKIASASPSTSRILLTAYAEMSVATSAINEGKVHGFLAKPWDDETLVLTVKQALERQKLFVENIQLRDALLLQKLSAAINPAANPKQVIEHSLNFLADEFDFCLGCAYLAGLADSHLEKVAEVRINRELIDFSQLNIQPDSILDVALAQRVPQIRLVFHNDGPKTSDRSPAMETAIPLLCNDKIMGALYFLQLDPSTPLVGTKVELLKAIGCYIGMALEMAMHHERAIEQDKMAAIGRAMACLSHDIRNILTQIQGGSELLRLTLESEKNPAIPRANDIIAKASHHLSDLVIEMLEFAKPQQPTFRSSNLVEMLEELSTEVKETSADKSVEVALKTHEQTIRVNLDKARFYRCLLNIALNGLEAMEGAGKLSIETREIDRPPSMGLSGDDSPGIPQKVLQISIIDTGPGIPREVQDKIFTPFFTTKKSKGTGLGLTIAKQIVEEHGGLIHVSSEPQKGTTFSIFLPLAETRAEHNPPPPTQAA